MLKNIARSADRRHLALIALICMVLGAAILLINRFAVDYLLRRDAEAMATSWAESFADNLPDLDAILAGQKPSPESLKFITQARQVGRVFRFKLFDRNGFLRLTSDDLHKLASPAAKLESHNAEAALAIASAKPFTKVEEGEGKLEPALFAETYAPVLRDEKIQGAVEVYIDQTENAHLFKGTFLYASLLVVALAILGFAVPAMGFYRRSRQKQVADEHVHFLAHHDVLTKLPNRGTFAAKVNDRLAANEEVSALHFIDVDLFKEINDSLGHDAGDELLTMVASRLTEISREDDIVARFGGDEFVIAQFGFDDEEQVPAAIKRIEAVLRKPYRLNNRELHVTFSIGTAMAPEDGANAETLIKHADIALYAVKANGRNGQRRFDASLDAQLQKRLQLETLVREATHKQSFDLHFQPLFTVGSVELTGFEALLRLNGHDGTPISPATFIPIAEDTGLIDEIGDWVMQRACRAAAQWPMGLQISVNLSAVQFHRKSVCGSVRRALEQSGLEPYRLVLEITESLLLAETESVLEQLQELKAMGVSVAMDDFGSGYSSLGYMLRFPFDRIKIDRSFVKAMATGDNNARTLVHTIIALGHTLNMKVTAEGVETLVQADQLRSMACDDAQGFLFGRPMPETDIAAVIMRQFRGKVLLKTAEETEQKQSA